MAPSNFRHRQFWSKARPDTERAPDPDPDADADADRSTVINSNNAS